MKSQQEIVGAYASFQEANEDLKQADMIKLSELSIEELEARLAMTNKVRDSLSQLAKAISREIEARRIQERVDQMPDSEREALRQALSAAGIPSAEAFGKV